MNEQPTNGTGTELETIPLSERRRQAFSLQLQNYHETLEEIEELRKQVDSQRYTIDCQRHEIEQLQGTNNALRSDYEVAVAERDEAVSDMLELETMFTSIQVQMDAFKVTKVPLSQRARERMTARRALIAEQVTTGVEAAGTA